MSFLVLADLKIWSDNTDPETDPSLQMALDQAEGIFMTYLNSPIKKPESAIVEELYLNKDSETIMPYYRPIISVSSLKYGYHKDHIFNDQDFVIERNLRIRNEGGFFAKGRYELSYFAGYDPIPNDLIYGIYSLALWVWQRGDASAIYQTKALIPENIKSLMRNYGAIL